MLDTYNLTKSCTTCVDDIHYNDFIGTYNSYSHGDNQNYSNSNNDRSHDNIINFKLVSENDSCKNVSSSVVVVIVVVVVC